MKLDTIVVGTSLETESDAVVAAGVALARMTGAHIRLVHAVQPFDVAFGAPRELDGKGPPDRDEIIRLEEQIRRAGLSAEDFSGWTVRVGSSHRVVLDDAAEHDADLIVLGTWERESRELGRTAERVLRTTRRPVLLLRDGLRLPPRRVALLTDLSVPAAVAVRTGEDFLEQMRDGAGCDRLLLLVLPQDAPIGPFSIEQIRRLGVEELERQHPLGEIPSCERSVRLGPVRKTIVDELEGREVDLAVAGTHGISGHDRCLLGSVVTWLAREAPCALLVVPPEAAGRARAELEDERRYAADWTWVSDESPAADA